MKRYKASLDNISIVITSFTFLLCAFTFYMSIKELGTLDNFDWKSIRGFLPSTIILIIVLFVAYLYKIQGYLISNNKLIIKRIIKDKVISFENIKNIRKIEPEELKGIIRVFGVGGFFGYFGSFRNSALGNLYYYTTRRKELILIELKNGKKLTISPDNIDELLSNINHCK